MYIANLLSSRVVFAASTILCDNEPQSKGTLRRADALGGPRVDGLSG